MNKEPGNLNFLEQFISKHYLQQPPWVRTFIFVIFALLLVYAIYRQIGGEFTVSGRILQKVEEGLKPAKNHDVQVGDKFFGTNSRGVYYIILSPLQYYKLMLDGKAAFRISKDENIFPKQTVAFQRFDQIFEDIELPLFPQVGQLHGRNELEALPSDLLVSSAWADQVQGDNRLFVEAAQLKSDLPWIKEGKLELQLTNNVLKLLSVRSAGMPAGLIPLVSGEKLFLGTDYYFNIPQGVASPLSGKIEVSAKKSIFSAYSEIFEVSMSQKYGVSFTASGNQGSKIHLLLLSPYDVAIYEKKDMENVKEQLKSEFNQKGFRVVESRSPLGYTAQTNALFGGKSVPFSALQSILEIVITHQIKIKTIQYRLDLRSGNSYEIQLGSSAAFNNAPPIPVEKLRQLLGASTEEEFKRLLTQ